MKDNFHSTNIDNFVQVEPYTEAQQEEFINFVYHFTLRFASGLPIDNLEDTLSKIVEISAVQGLRNRILSQLTEIHRYLQQGYEWEYLPGRPVSLKSLEFIIGELLHEWHGLLPKALSGCVGLLRRLKPKQTES